MEVKKIIYGLMPAIPTEEYLIIKGIKQKKVGFTMPTYMTEIKLLDSRTNLHYYLSVADAAHHPEFYLSDQALLERLTANPKDKDEQNLRLLGMFALGISDDDEIDDPKYEKIHHLLHLLSFLNDKTDEEMKELSPLFFNQKGSEIHIPSDDPLLVPSDLDQITKKHPELDPEYDFSQWDIIDLKNQAMEDQQSQRVVELALKKDKKTIYIAGIKEQKKIHIDVSNQSYFDFIRQHEEEKPQKGCGLITAPMKEEQHTKVEPSESVKQLFDLILKILDWDTHEIVRLQEEIHQDIQDEKTAD